MAVDDVLYTVGECPHLSKYMWPDQMEGVKCQEFWFLDTSNYCKQIFLYLIFFSWKLFNITFGQKVILTWVFRVQKTYASSTHPYLKLILDEGQHMTHSTGSGSYFIKIPNLMSHYLKSTFTNLLWHHQWNYHISRMLYPISNIENNIELKEQPFRRNSKKMNFWTFDPTGPFWCIESHLSNQLQ